MQEIIKALRFLVGLVFLLSGLLKAIDTAAFADLMSEYGATWFGLAAPLIIFAEIFLGAMLVFDFYPKHIAWATAIFLLAVSSIYLYGVTARGITNCGCFGPLTLLNSKPWLTFTRNSILMAMLLPTLVRRQEKITAITIPSVIFFCVYCGCRYVHVWFFHAGSQMLAKANHLSTYSID